MILDSFLHHGSEGVHDLPCITHVTHNFDRYKNFFLDVDRSDHLVQELSSVGQKLLHL